MYMHRYGAARVIAAIRPSHQRHLFELNWQCRKTALWVSYGGRSPSAFNSLSSDLAALSLSSSSSSPSPSAAVTKSTVSGKKNNHVNKHNKHSKASSRSTQEDHINIKAAADTTGQPGKGIGMVNILAELRIHGKEDCLKLIFSWI